LPLLLVYWQGRSYAQAARELSITLSALHGRLERGRQRLADRLRSRGFAPGDLGAVLAVSLATVAVPGELLARTVGLGIAGAVVPAGVLALAATAGTGNSISASIAALVVGMGTIGLMGGVAAPKQPRDKVASPPTGPLVTQVGPRVDAVGDALPEGAIARLGTDRLRHGCSIYGASISPDGKLIASTGGHQITNVWDARSGKKIREIRAPKLHANAVAISPDGSTVVVGGLGGCFVFDLHTAELRKELPSAPVFSVVFSSDGALVATGHETGEVTLWEFATWTKLHEFPANSSKRWRDGPHGPSYGALPFHPMARLLALGRVITSSCGMSRHESDFEQSMRAARGCSQ
jgi:hypothetical protein